MINTYKILFVTVEDAHELHDEAIQELGGRPGVHDASLLESAMNQPAMMIDYGSVEEKEITYLAATYFFHIIKNHPFNDGNKRTGLLTAVKFLAKNHYEIEVSSAIYDDLYQLAIDTAASKKNKKEIAAYFKHLIETQPK